MLSFFQYMLVIRGKKITLLKLYTFFFHRYTLFLISKWKIFLKMLMYEYLLLNKNYKIYDRFKFRKTLKLLIFTAQF